MIGTESLAGGDEHLARLAVDGNVIDFITDERTVFCGEPFNGFHTVSADEIDAIIHSSNPFTIATINSDTLHIDAIQQVIGQIAAIIARNLDLGKGKVVIEDL